MGSGTEQKVISSDLHLRLISSRNKLSQLMRNGITRICTVLRLINRDIFCTQLLGLRDFEDYSGPGMKIRRSLPLVDPFCYKGSKVYN